MMIAPIIEHLLFCMSLPTAACPLPAAPQIIRSSLTLLSPTPTQLPDPGVWQQAQTLRQRTRKRTWTRNPKRRYCPLRVPRQKNAERGGQGHKKDDVSDAISLFTAVLIKAPSYLINYTVPPLSSLAGHNPRRLMTVHAFYTFPISSHTRPSKILKGPNAPGQHEGRKKVVPLQITTHTTSSPTYVGTPYFGTHAMFTYFIPSTPYLTPSQFLVLLQHTAITNPDCTCCVLGSQSSAPVILKLAHPRCC